MAAVPATVSARAALVRRNTLLLLGAQAALLTAMSTVLVVGVVAVADLTGRERFGGVFLALFNLSAAAGAFLVGRLMDRVGRRPGLALGHSLFGLGGLGAGLAVASGSGWALVAMALPLGAGFGAGQLGRVAVADMYPTERRGRYVGLLIAAGTVGAIGGPPLVAGIETVADSRVAPWFMTPVLAALAVGAALALRPDPRDLAVVEEHAVAPTRRRSALELLRQGPLRAAVITIGVAQAAMVAVMGVTPIVIDDRGGSSFEIALVISGHMAGMFAIAPAIGVLLDRFGRRPGLLGGGVVSAGGALLGSFVHATPLVGIGLFLVGLGWSTCYLAATATISDVTSPFERGGALGLADLVAQIASAAGALSGAFVLEAAGIAVVGTMMAALMLPALVFVLPLREPEPGRWTLRPAPS